MSEPTEQEQKLDLPDAELVAKYVEVVPTVDIVRAVYVAIEQARQQLREDWRKHPEVEPPQ